MTHLLANYMLSSKQEKTLYAQNVKVYLVSMIQLAPAGRLCNYTILGIFSTGAHLNVAMSSSQFSFCAFLFLFFITQSALSWHHPEALELVTWHLKLRWLAQNK